VTASVVTGQYVDPKSARILFDTYATTWRDAQVHRPTTAAQVEVHLRMHILPTFGGQRIGSIRRSDVQAWVKGRGEELAPTTVAVVYQYLSMIFSSAVEDRLIASSPCSRISLPKREQSKVVPYSTDAVLRLFDAVPARYRSLVVLTAGTGLRQGEVFGLTAEHVDFLRRVLHVEQQLIAVGGRTYLGPPKSESSRRSIPMPSAVVESLAQHMAAFPTGPEGLIFTKRDGGPINRGSFSREWVPAVAAAGLPRGSRFHGLRHYYASLLIRFGESVKVVQARLGHATAAETLNTYAHLWPDSEDRTRQAVDAVLGGSGSLETVVSSDR